MLIFIWRKWGWIVPVSGIVSLLLTQAMVNVLRGSGTYESNVRVFSTFALLLAAAVVFAVSGWRKAKESSAKYKSEFFFVPLRFWVYVYIALAAFSAIVD